MAEGSRSDGFDWEYELKNGWSPETLIILQGMKEIRDDVKDLHEAQSEAATTVALLTQSVEGLPNRVRTLEDDKTVRDTRRKQIRRLTEWTSATLVTIIVPTLIALFETGVL